MKVNELNYIIKEHEYKEQLRMKDESKWQQNLKCKEEWEMNVHYWGLPVKYAV